MMRSWRSYRLDGRACVQAIIGMWTAVLMVGAWTASVQGVPTPQATPAAKSVWDGVYSEAQADRGKSIYEQNCAFCHLSDLTGQGFAPALVEHPVAAPAS